jgi:hypothetical protein
VAKVVINTGDMGKIAVALFFFLFGIMWLFNVGGDGMRILVGVCALIAGALQLVELK